MRSRGVLRCANVVRIHLLPPSPLRKLQPHPSSVPSCIPQTIAKIYTALLVFFSLSFCLSCIYKRTPLRILRPGVSICLKKNSPLLAWSLHLGPDKV
ncbi:hypothetical protein MUK42_11249 [Musa troglodytarum]|uniref:Uncharacterized protein n=1 Tax=Musa troglodytarum TaxID=320322 RepID=A0A9E7GIA7_9LILI|nr:hypothetical protein MUK42_11249 [Musa troglodytarum]